MAFFLKINSKNLDLHARNKKHRFIRKILYLPEILKFIFTHPLNNKIKIRSILKFIFFQIKMRLFFNKKKIFKWIDKSIVEVKLGDSSLIANYYTGLYEFESMSFLLHSLKPSYLFIDVGANLGCYSILASAIVGSNTISFEPSTKAYLTFLKQVNINNISNLCTVLNLGLGEKKEKKLFTIERNELNRVALSNIDENLEEVNFSTLDLELDESKKMIMKIDVEGFEMNVLKGGKNILKSPNLLALIIEINGFNEFYGFNSKDIHNYILSYNFKPYSYKPFARKLEKIDKINSFNADFIYIKNYEEIQDNCIKSKKRVFYTNHNLEF